MDGAEQFHAMYVEMCEACKRAGLSKPTPEQWVETATELIADAARQPATAMSETNQVTKRLFYQGRRISLGGIYAANFERRR